MTAAPITAAPATADLGGWLHTLSPVALDLGVFALRWYGLSYLAGFIAGYLLLRFLIKRGAARLNAERAFDVILALVAGVVVGGRLGYVLLYEPQLLGLIDGFPFWGVLAVNRGGMASHGGILGVIVAAWWISRGVKDESGRRVGAFPALHMADLCALIAPAGLLFGRLANFINGELLGKVIANPGQPAPWYAVRYPQEILSGQPLPHTTEQLDRVQSLAQSTALPGESWQTGFERVMAALQKGDASTIAVFEPLLSARHPTQLYQAAVEGVLVGVVVWLIAAKRRAPGVIGAWFLIVYAIGRIALDTVRLPDPGIAQLAGLTRGQLYSGVMLLAGFAILLVAIRGSREKISGGWFARS